MLTRTQFQKLTIGTSALILCSYSNPSLGFLGQGFFGQARPRFSVTYNGNGNTGGSVPVDNNLYESGSPVSVLSNSNSLSRTNYTFSGWNTSLSGNGTNYPAGTGTLTMGTSDVTLYASWVFLTNGIKAYYKLDSDLSDYSGGAHHLNYRFATPMYKPATIANGFVAGWSSGFSGQYASHTASHSDFDMGSAFSIAVWASWDGAVTPGSDNYLIYRGNSSSLVNGDYFMRMNSSYVITVGFRNNVGGTYTCASISTLPTNTMTHLIGVYDGSSLKVFFNGQLNNTCSVGLHNLGTSASGFAIGNMGATGGRWNLFSGVLDEVRVYNRALSNVEAQALYNYRP